MPCGNYPIIPVLSPYSFEKLNLESRSIDLESRSIDLESSRSIDLESRSIDLEYGDPVS